MNTKPKPKTKNADKPRTFVVNRKKGIPLKYVASSYVEDKKAGRIYFVLDDRTSKERFVLLSEVAGIDIEYPPQPQLSRAEIVAQLKASGLTTADIFKTPDAPKKEIK